MKTSGTQNHTLFTTSTLGGGERYRFGFSGHEKINEIYGEGNTVDMGDRWLDVRLGRTFKMDAKAGQYPDVSPYSYAANNPVFFIDPDGKEVRAYTEASRELVIKTLNYTFGENHGFVFVNNTLIHGNGGKAPETLTPQQSLMFNYFYKTLVQSKTITQVRPNTRLSAIVTLGGEVRFGGIIKDVGASVFFYPSKVESLSESDGRLFEIRTPAINDIIISPKVIDQGINLHTESGTRLFSPEHATLHEFAHAIVNTIMEEFDGIYKDGDNIIDFNKMDDKQKEDWAIQFTNTLLQSQNKPLETGKGQHGRSRDQAPSSTTVAPLNK